MPDFDDTPIDDTPSDEVIPDEETPDEDADDTTGSDDAAVEQLRAELEAANADLATAKQALAEAEQKARQLDPTADVSGFLYTTREELIDFLGLDTIDSIVENQIATDNKVRTRQGFDRLTYSPAEKKSLRDQVIDELLSDREAAAPPSEGFLSRSLKMLSPSGALIQIPYEGQINNVAGSLADGYVRYEKKGYKRVRPNLCPSTDCYREAVVENGEFTFFGYCSRDHYLRTERPEDARVAV